MIAVLSGIAARLWRRRIARHEQQREMWTAEFMAWKRAHPDRCMYCAYTRWANNAQGMRMKLDPHYCVEGHSPPQPLPKASAIQQIHRWWLVRKLHGDCVMWDAQLHAGLPVPHGACTTCTPRIARLVELGLPQAKAKVLT